MLYLISDGFVVCGVLPFAVICQQQQQQQQRRARAKQVVDGPSDCYGVPLCLCVDVLELELGLHHRKSWGNVAENGRPRMALDGGEYGRKNSINYAAVSTSEPFAGKRKNGFLANTMI